MASKRTPSWLLTFLVSSISSLDATHETADLVVASAKVPLCDLILFALDPRLFPSGFRLLVDLIELRARRLTLSSEALGLLLCGPKSAVEISRVLFSALHFLSENSNGGLSVLDL